MKTPLKLVLMAGTVGVAVLALQSSTAFVELRNTTKSTQFAKRSAATIQLQDQTEGEKPCVFLSVMGEQPTEGYAKFKVPEKVASVIENGENWLINSQNPDGGWSCGARYGESSAIGSDPATTSMAAMALYRCGYRLDNSEKGKKMEKALNFLLSEVEKNKDNPFITQARNTQIQYKLGQNIDAALTLQYLNQIVTTVPHENTKSRINNAIQICIDKIEKSYDENGKVTNAGWAGVLQSSFANTALEKAATNKDVVVDKRKIEAARNYQKSNFNTATKQANTADGAGVILYAVSSSVRGSAEENNEAQQVFAEAKKQGKLDKNASFTTENLQKIGVSREKALSYETAYNVYKTAKEQALDDNVMTGFGNNGGEEFLSFLQTGESLSDSKDSDWKKWYDNVSGKLVKIQNHDGSWNGHHCITSPVFCTATCLLILSIENEL